MAIEIEMRNDYMDLEGHERVYRAELWVVQVDLDTGARTDLRKVDYSSRVGMIKNPQQAIVNALREMKQLMMKEALNEATMDLNQIRTAVETA